MINWISECGNNNPSSKLMNTDHPDLVTHGDPQVIPDEDRLESCKRRVIPVAKAGVSIVAHLGFFTSVALIVWCFVTMKRGQANETYFYIVFSLTAAFTYILIMVEAAASDVYLALKSYSEKITAETYIDKVKEARPHVKWVAECYHYEYSDSDEMNAESSSKRPHMMGRKRQRIITGNDKEVFHFSNWRDYTRDITGLLTKPVIRFECSKVFIFKDENSKSIYMQQYQKFRERIRRRDEFMEHDEELTIPGFQQRVTACEKSSNRPCWLSGSVFWMCTLLLLTWPYRLAFKRASCKVYIVFVKQLEVTQS